MLNEGDILQFLNSVLRVDENNWVRYGYLSLILDIKVYCGNKPEIAKGLIFQRILKTVAG